MKRLMIFMLALMLVFTSFWGTGIVEASSSGVEIEEVETPTQPREEQPNIHTKDSKKAVDSLRNLNMVDGKSFSEGLDFAKGFNKVVSKIISFGFYIIFFMLILNTLPDLIYINFSWSRNLLGGGNSPKDGGAYMTRNDYPMGGGYGGMGNQRPMRGHFNGVISDEARLVVADDGITSKNWHYILNRVWLFITLGIAIVLLTTNIFFTSGLSIGEFILQKFVMFLRSLGIS